MNRSTHAAGWSAILSGQYGLYTAMLNGGMLLFAINTFVVATVMPSVVEDLGRVGLLTWAFSLFAVGSIVGAAGAGPARERWGARRAYAGAGLLLGIGLLGSTLAPDMLTFVGWRLVQGVGGGAIAAQSYGLVGAMFPERLRGHVLSTISTTWGVATLGGPAYGALFSDGSLWRWAFGSLVPLTIVFAALAWLYVAGKPADGARARIPYWRLALLAFAVLAFSATSLTRNGAIQVLLVVAAIALTAAAFLRDARAQQRIFPRGVTAIHTELGALYWLFFLISVMISFVNAYTTYYLQVLHGLAPLTAGYVFAIQSFLWTAAALAVAGFPASQTTRLIISGLTLMLLSALAIALFLEPGPVWAIAFSIAVSGVGIGFINNPAIQKIIAIAPPDERHMAGASVQTVRNIGMSFGAAAAGAVAVSAGLVDGAPQAIVAHAMQWVYGVNAVIGLIALAIAALVLRNTNGERKE